jgi:carboxyl-terminal processing protease
VRALLALAGCWSASEAPEPVDPALEAERRVLRAAEEALLLRTAREALAGGRGDDAARAVQMGLDLSPTAFEPLVDEVAKVAGPAAAAALVERTDPERARALRAEAARVEVARRYGPARPQSEALVRGVTISLGDRVLAGVRAEYVVAPDEAAMAEAAGRRLGWVAEALGVEGAPVAGPVEARIAGAIDAGVPEPIAVAEGVEGALGALDAYSRAVWPAEIAAWSQHHEGVYVGVGVELVDAPDGRVLVDVPVPGGPAWAAGLRQGDVVLRVGGAAVASAEDAAARLRGDEGTTVAVDVERAGEPMAFEVARAPIVPETVRGWQRRDDNGWDLEVAPGVAWVHVSAFRPHTDEDFDALLQGHAPTGVVIDLRGNGGGDVMAAVNIADRFVADGILAQLQGRTIAPPEAGEGEAAWNEALEGHALEGVPVVVLVDRHTASAAELLAGALRERVGAKLVGERTFGKGLSQALRGDDATGVAWQVTTGTWTLPSGAPLEAPGGERGLAPDVEVTLSAAERFQVDVLRRQREHPRSHADGSPIRYLGSVGRPDLPRLGDDPPLRAALRALAAAP